MSQSLKLPQPERLDMGIEKRSHTVSGIPISNIQVPHQETQDFRSPTFTVGDTQKELGELEKESSQLSIANSQELPSNETRDQSQYCDDRFEASFPRSGNRSRHISEHIDPGTACNYQGSQSGTRSPSLHNTTGASGYHSISDLSTASTHNNIPPTEGERQFVLLHKVLELLEKKSPTSPKDVVNDGDPNPEHDESETEDRLSQPTEVAPNLKLKMAIKRKSDSDGTLESSHESCRGML